MYNYPNRGQELVYFNQERIPSQSILEEIHTEQFNKDSCNKKIYRCILSEGNRSHFYK